MIAFGVPLDNGTEKGSIGWGFVLLVASFGMIVYGVYAYVRRIDHPRAAPGLNAQTQNENGSRRALWERSYYCGRCDVVWDAETNRSAPSANAQALWA